MRPVSCDDMRGPCCIGIEATAGSGSRRVLAILANVVFAEQASAHVKWFCAYDVAGQPRGLENVLCPDFELLIALALAVLVTGCVVEGSAVGNAMLRALDRVTEVVRDNTELMFRAGCGAFFVALWAIGGILLTPELKTDSAAIVVAAARHRGRHAVAPDAAAVGARHRVPVRDRRSGNTARSISPTIRSSSASPPISRWSGLQRDLFGAAPARRGALGRRRSR